MKSQRYDILPRVRLRHGADGPVFRCTWKDPGDLTQLTGWKLVYVAEYVGYGATITEAMQNCQLNYIKRKLARDKVWDSIDTSINRPTKGLDIRFVATSNLPWWKRLFRV
jgi:hypothetical protein